MSKGQVRRKPELNSKDKVALTLGGSLSPEEMHCRMDVVFGEAYKSVVEAVDQQIVLAELCQGLADAMDIAFIWVGKKGDGELLIPVAFSGDGPLQKELLRVPEHDDDSVLGDGPAIRALRSREIQLLHAKDEGFQPWLKAAKKQGVNALLSAPIQSRDVGSLRDWVVVFADAHYKTLEKPANREIIQNCVERMASVCKSLVTFREMDLVNRALQTAGNPTFITDTDGTIVWANDSFCRIAGHERESVIGRNPRILKSGKQGFRYYNRLWRTISSGKVWNGETVDRDSNGELYTIRQTVSPVSMGEKLTHYISIQEDISDAKAMQHARERAQRIDELTGLMTPGLFTERYERAVSAAVTHQESLALLLLTINDFDSLMASLGRDIEELVLETLGDRIRCNLKEGDFAANLSSGDFAVVLHSVSSSEEARMVGEEMLEVLNEPFPLLGDKLYLSRGLGVAFIPDDSNDADELMRIADARAGGKE